MPLAQISSILVRYHVGVTLYTPCLHVSYQRDDHVLRRLIANDVYRVHTFEEIACLVAPEVAARLDPDEHYGIQWFNRKKTSTSTIGEPDGQGGRRYRKRSTVILRPREEWIAIPVPAYLPRALVDRARKALEENSRTFERNNLARGWELRGLVRCSCGSKMRTLSTQTGYGSDYHYYTCGRRRTLGKMCSCTQKSLRYSQVEPPVWNFVSDLLTDPEKIRSGMEALMEQDGRVTRRRHGLDCLQHDSCTPIVGVQRIWFWPCSENMGFLSNRPVTRCRTFSKYS